MAKHTKENIELHFHKNKVTPGCGGGWFLYKLEEGKRRTRVGSVASKKDKPGKRLCIEYGLVLLWLKQFDMSSHDLVDTLSGGSDYKVNKLFGDNIKRYKAKTITPTAVKAAFNKQLDSFDNALAGVGCVALPSLLFNSVNADYTVDMAGMMSLELDNADDVVLTLQDYVELFDMFFSKTPNKWQRPILLMFHDWLDLDEPGVQRNYEKTWRRLIDACPRIATSISADLDEYFKQQGEKKRLVITRPGDLEQTSKDMDEYFLRQEKALRERSRF